MAASSRYPRADASDRAEQDDIACAIATSLTSLQLNAQRNASTVPEQWTPKSQLDLKVYRRQKEAEESVLVDPSWKNESLGQTDGNSQNEEPRQAQVVHVKSHPLSGTSTPTELDSHSPTTQNMTEDVPTSPRQTIDDRIEDMMQGNPVDLPWIDDHAGDTWVFIDPAAQQPEQTDRMYQAYVERYRRPLMMESTVLKSLQSPFFDKLFEPSYQYRIVRRRQLKGKLPTQIKYVIDLTPPTEGEEAAWLMSELCCIDGLRNWWQADSRWQVSKTMVGGQDDFTTPPANTGEARSVPEISPIRHRACIERVLNAIRNIDPYLDSAVKVYTTFIVACFFEISGTPLTDYIVRWVRAPPNSLFIEAFPEVTLKMGDGLRCSQLVRDSFAILVGEEALELRQRQPNKDYTIYGRKKNDVPESYKTRIEYASKNLQSRVSRIFEDLIEPDMKWMETLPEFKKLMSNEDANMTSVLTETKTALKAFVRGAIYGVLYSDLSWAPNRWLGAYGGDSLYPRISQQTFWNSRSIKERILTTTFWGALKQSAFMLLESSNTTNLTSLAKRGAGWGFNLCDDSVNALVQRYGVIELPFAYLRILISRCCHGQATPDSDTAGSLQPLKQQAQDFSNVEGLPSRPESPEISTLPSPSQLWDSEGKHVGPLHATAEKVSQAMVADLGRQQTTSDHDNMVSKFSDEYLVLRRLNFEIVDYIQSICDMMAGPPDADGAEPMCTDMTLTLVCLDQSEWKYLPLFAGGLDDGSGGVFNDDVPPADVGFSTAGPHVHTGSGSSTASSDFDFVGLEDLDSTHHTSTMTNDGFSDQMDHRQVYDGNSDLWDQIMRQKNTEAASHMETATMVAPSTAGDESVDEFVLPVRSRGLDAESSDSLGNTHTLNAQDSESAPEIDQDNYESIFADSDEDDNDTNDGEDDEDDDTATEKGDDDHITSEDDDLVIV
ncbi:MAG: hypothetical protein L6R41_007650 [Letrouitia leprolyta]|nr:MAG: hypothetical protein L6R41_007650 [Letrouitia leprolyta]